MTNKTENCRMCLGIAPSNTFTEMDDIKMQMFKIISPSEDLAGVRSIMCDKCSESFQQSFDFKTTCLNNEDYLNTFFCDSNVKLVLQEVVTKNTEIEHSVKPEDESICRLCFRYFESTYFSTLDRIEDDYFLREMIEKCLPEINLNSTKDPLMCHDCMQSLQNQFNLISTCVDTNDKINDYISCNNISSCYSEVNLLDVVKFTLHIKTENEMEVKKEVQGWTSENIQTFEDIGQSEIHIKVEETLSLEDDYGNISRDQSSPFNEDIVKMEAIKKNSKGLYICDQCPHVTTRKDSLQKHLKIHQHFHSKRTTCDSVIDGHSTIKLHEELDVEGAAVKKPPRVYICNQCNHKTTKKDSLILHLLKHQDTYQFKCDKCDFATKWRTSLRQHLWLHEEVNMYNCAFCPYKTRYKKHLKRHSVRHKNSENVLEYQCQYCDFKSKSKDYFKLHSQTKHGKKILLEDINSFACDQCDFVTSKRCFLTKHRNMVHKKLVCEFCGFQTSLQSHMKDHMLKHKREDEVVMLQCGECDFRTKYKNSLRTHLLRHYASRKRGKGKKLKQFDLS